jgi:hypothetical protein
MHNLLGGFSFSKMVQLVAALAPQIFFFYYKHGQRQSTVLMERSLLGSFGCEWFPAGSIKVDC